MIPILAAMGVSVLSTLAEKAAATLLNRDLGGRTAVNPTGRSFHAILERSQSAQSTQAALPAAPRGSVAARPPAALSRTAQEMIGRNVAANGSVLELHGQISPTLQYRLPAAAASVQIEVQDLQGTVVRTVRLGQRPGGLHQLSFDGRGLPSGLYLYRVIAVDGAGQPMAHISTASGRVMGVQFQNGQPFLNVGRALVPFTGVNEMNSRRQ